jgi:alpha-galactosidase
VVEKAGMGTETKSFVGRSTLFNMPKIFSQFLYGVAAITCLAVPARAQVWLESMDLKNVQQGFGKPGAARTVEGHPITLAGKTYQHGIGTHAVGVIVIDLHGEAESFQATMGVDDEHKPAGSVTFTVFVDGKKMKQTKVMHGGDVPETCSVDLKGAQKLVLVAGDAGDGIRDDHADWADASITMASTAKQKPEMMSLSNETPRLKMTETDPKPVIHGPKITGATPGRPFLFSVGATGTAPLTYAAQNLPEGLKIDPATGIISGSLAHDVTSKVALTVSNALGKASRDLTIVGGANQLALTPPMGWNSWNVWASTVDEGKVRDAATELISTGLKAYGYQYVNIDDCWQGSRDAQGKIQPNKKFPDMKALCDDLHAKGFRAGIYSSPGPTTCGGYAGSYQHEAQDAQTYADWGFDYLKYDLCSYGQFIKDKTEASVKPPYVKMSGPLVNSSRDIVYSLCEYGDGDVWKWGADPDVRGNLWRTHGDIDDVWTGSSAWGSDRGIYDIIRAQANLAPYAGPGHWNDPDMLMVGIVGFGHPHPTELTPNEQITHISMWCMMAAPFLIGCDLTKLDDFTKAILTNDEVLDIDQDSLGKAASRVVADDNGTEVWARPLSDGTEAVALLNAMPFDQTITVRWPDIGLKGPQPVRDIWLHQDLGLVDQEYSVAVPAHGTVMLKIGQPGAGK